MKKRFLSALVLGALTVTSTNTLISCKDYDDDISNLEERINANASAIEKIQALIKSGQVITGVSKDGTGVTFTMSNGDTYSVTNGAAGKDGKDGVDGKDASVWTPNADGYWYCDGEKTQYPCRGEKGEKGDPGQDGQGGQGTPGKDGKDGGYYKPNSQTGKFDFVAADGTVTPTDISWLGQGMTAIDKGSYYELHNVWVTEGETTAPQTIKVPKGAEVGSIVYSPEEYYNGIQAIMLDNFEYEPIKNLFAANVNTDQSKLTPADERESKLSYVPNVIMRYYLNPKNAFVDTEDLSKFEFLATDAAYTRAFSGSNLVISDVQQEMDAEKKPTGLFTVSARVNKPEDIKQNISDGVTVAALRYSDGETAVVSDFAALHSQKVNNFSVRFKDGTVLYANPKAARDNSEQLEVARDKKLDLSTKFAAYYSANGQTPVAFTDTKLADAGFELQYERIGYIADDADAQNTNQSTHCTLDGSILKPNGLPADEGRTPLVRVKLVDTKNLDKAGKPNVIAVGYVKVMITAAVAEPIVLADPIAKDKDYTLACGTNEFTSFAMTWQDMEAMVLNKVGLSKADFEAVYELDCASSGDAKQFKKNADGTFEEVAPEDVFGKVRFTNSGTSTTETNVLQWTIGNEEAYEAAKTAAANKQIIVAWKAKSSVEGYKSRGTIYVTLQWNITGRNINPATEIKDSEDKTFALWSEGYGYAKAGVNDNCDFNVTTASSFNKDPEVIVRGRLGATYGGLLTGMDYTFTKAEAAGYTLKVATDKKSVTCNGSTIVSIDTDGKTLKYGTSDLAKEILNSAAEPLKLTIKMTPESCAPAENVIKLDNNIYAMKFIRPMSITKHVAADITDRAETWKESKVTMEFKNWLNENVDFAKYGVTAMAVDPSKSVTSDFARGNINDALPAGLKITYDGSTFGTLDANGKMQYGVIKYWRDESLVVVRDFKVRVPVIVTYKWGQLSAELEFTVKKTN